MQLLNAGGSQSWPRLTICDSGSKHGRVEFSQTISREVATEASCRAVGGDPFAVGRVRSVSCVFAFRNVAGVMAISAGPCRCSLRIRPANVYGEATRLWTGYESLEWDAIG